MKVLTVVGARPQFIKAWPVGEALQRSGIHEVLLHTGQHYDASMSDNFFTDFKMRRPDIELQAGSGTHGEQTARMLEGIERAILELRPDFSLLYGDTNSTLAGALATAKLHVPVAHVEAGLRSFNRRMPEELNRILTDHASSLLFCPTETAVANLAREGITRGVFLVGDVMLDALRSAVPVALRESNVLGRLGLKENSYYLATMHRAENVDNPARLQSIWDALESLSAPVLVPVHPRTKSRLSTIRVRTSNVLLTEPCGYFDMVRLMIGAKAVLTDSGGMQKEACWLGRPCVTMRDETEWTETVMEGRNSLVGADTSKIIKACHSAEIAQKPAQLTSAAAVNGVAASVRIAETLAARL